MKTETQQQKAKANANAQCRTTAIILAAGKGTRMNSPLPKVLHPVAGQPMIARIIEACKVAGIDEVRVVLGHGLKLVESVVEPLGARCFVQAQQLGTGDAVKSADPGTIEGDIIILNGDHPLIEAKDILELLGQYRTLKFDLAVVTAKLKNPGAFGRVVRHQGSLRAIVEAKDASADTLRIQEVNTGTYLTSADYLSEYLPRISNQNSKGEFYLTDLISLGAEDSRKLGALMAPKRLAFGVNTQAELAKASKQAFRAKARELLESGVLMLNPASSYIEATVKVAPGSVIYPNVYLRGNTVVGSFTAIEPNCYVVDCKIGDSVLVKANSYLEKAILHNRSSVGPFARIRPESEIGEEAHIGNFVEIKKSKLAARVKAGHLTYLGDAEVGEGTNVGCGTITCNYAVDRKKYKTVIGKNVFVGSDTQFIAPVQVGDGAIIGSGSTITKNVPAKALAVGRAKQIIKENYSKEEPEKAGE